jgi:hypothetical protein
MQNSAGGHDRAAFPVSHMNEAASGKARCKGDVSEGLIVHTKPKTCKGRVLSITKAAAKSLVVNVDPEAVRIQDCSPSDDI